MYIIYINFRVYLFDLLIEYSRITVYNDDSEIRRLCTYESVSCRTTQKAIREGH